MPDTARSAVDHRDDLPFVQTEDLRSIRIDDLIDVLHLDEVVAAAHRAELGSAAFLGLIGHGRCVRLCENAVVLASSAYGTAAILLRSGIDHLPVGENLADHVGTGVGWEPTELQTLAWQEQESLAPSR